MWPWQLAVALLTPSVGQETCPASGCGQRELVCLAVLARPQHEQELEVRVKNILEHQHFDFAHRFLLLDTREPVPPGFAVRARQLVQRGHFDEWLVVNYSAEYVAQVNRSASLDPHEHPPEKGWKERRVVDHVQFNEDYEEEVQMGHYFATDWCKHRYLALMELDVLWMSGTAGSWVASGLRLLRSHGDLVLVLPGFPGLETRRSRRRPWTREVPKLQKGLDPAVQAIDITCDHPYSLPGLVSLLDLQRYHGLGARQQVREHRCGGQLVKGKKCKSLIDIRGCGGLRQWEYALECALCNSPGARQATLQTGARAQRAPLARFRAEVAELREALRDLESGSLLPVPGLDFSRER